jgi:hypothetical protein
LLDDEVGGLDAGGFDTCGWGLFDDEVVGRGLGDGADGLGAGGFDTCGWGLLDDEVGGLDAGGFDTCGGRDIAGVAPDGFDFDADDLELLDDDDLDDDDLDWASTGSDQLNVKAMTVAMASLFKTCGEKHALRYDILFMMI